MAYYTIKSAYLGSNLKIGDVVRIPERTGEINDTSHGRYSEYILVDKDRYGTGNALFLRRYVLPKSTTNFTKLTKRMNAQGRYEYQESEIDIYLNGHSSYSSSFLKSAFGSNGMEHVLKNCSMPQTNYNNGDVRRDLTFSRKIFLPNRQEMNLTASIQFSYLTGSTLSYFSNASDAKRAATTYGSASAQEYMLRDISYQLVNWGYRTVEGGDNAGNEKSTFSLDDWLENENGIRPIICIDDKCSLEITNGVKWIIPNLPTDSTGITGSVPNSVNSDEHFTVSWSGASDVDTALTNISYRLEARFNSGSWELRHFTLPGETSFVDLIPYDRSNSSVTYRITAFDDYQNGDGVFKTLGTASIHNNQAPKFSGPISVIGNYKNSSLKITWNAATDADNNLSKYRLYRIVDGGSKELVSEIFHPLTQYTDTSGDWDTVIYSVIAVDNDDAQSTEIASSLITLVEENTMTLEFTGSTSPNHIQDTDSGQDMTDDEATAVFTLTDPDNEDKSYSYTLLLDGSVLVSGGITHRNIEIATAFVDDSVVISPKIFKPEWQKLRNGNHTLQMTVADSNGMTRTVSKTFVKQCNTVTYVTDTYGLAQGTTDIPGSFTLNITGNFPANAIYEVKVCRNANASTPTETTLNQSEINKINSNESIEFSDAAPALNEFGFYVKATLKRPVGDTFEGAYYVTSISGMIGENIFVYLQSQIDDLKNRMQ